MQFVIAGDVEPSGYALNYAARGAVKQSRAIFAQCNVEQDRGGWIRTPHGYRRQKDVELKDVVKAQHGGKVTYHVAPLSAPELKENYEIVLEAVKQDEKGRAIELAAPKHKVDREIVLGAMTQLVDLAGSSDEDYVGPNIFPQYEGLSAMHIANAGAGALPAVVSLMGSWQE